VIDIELKNKIPFRKVPLNLGFEPEIVIFMDEQRNKKSRAVYLTELVMEKMGNN
jgi:hypothetical protein